MPGRSPVEPAGASRAAVQPEIRAAPDDGSAGEGEWHRLVPAAILPLVVRGAIDIARNAWQGLAGLAAALHVTLDDSMLAWKWLAVALAGLLVLAGILQWWFFRYRLGKDSITLRHGVLTREQVHLAFARVQNVRVGQPFYLRPFGIVTLALDGAGSSGAEVRLPALPKAAADAITRLVREAAAGSIDGGAAGGAARPGAVGEAEGRGDRRFGATESPLIRRRLGRLVLHGLSSNAAWVMGGAFASIAGGNIKIVGPILRRAIEGLIGPVDTLSWVGAAAVMTAGLGFVMLLFLLLSMAGAIVHYYGFTLAADARGWRAFYGLLDRQEVAVGKTKLQALTLRQTMMGRLIGIWEIHLHQTGGESAGKVGQKIGRHRLLIPAVRTGELQDILAALLPGASWPLRPMRGVDRFFIVHRLRYVALAALGLGGVSAFLLHGMGGPGTATAAGVSVFGAVVLAGRGVLAAAWRQHRFAEAREALAVTRGLIGRQVILFQPFKTQAVRLVAGPAMRRRGLRRLVVSLAGARAVIGYLREDEAKALAHSLIRRAARDPRPWY